VAKTRRCAIGPTYAFIAWQAFAAIGQLCWPITGSMRYVALHHQEGASFVAGPAGSCRRIIKMSASNQARLLPTAEPKFLTGLGQGLNQGHGLLQRFFRTVAARLQHAREMDELYSFSDRELGDLALSRSDLPAIQKGMFRRD
jgi:uncharacterized protein YjiS (DUF1127 family)